MNEKYGIDILVNDRATKALAKIRAGAKATVAGLSEARKKAETGMGGMGSIGGGGGGFSMGGAAAGAVALAVGMIGKAAITTTGEFEKMEAVLTNTLQSPQRAKASMALIQDFAAKTPFQVNQLTGAFVKLANRGFTPSMDQMKSLGDLASSTGKDFDQLVEAMLDASTGEFERLKEFGVKASVNTKKGTVSFNFKGQVSEIQNTEAAINQYILSLGKQKGVMGSMEAISKTTEGQLSNLSDTMDMLYLEIGTQFQPVTKATIATLSKATQSIKEWLNTHPGFIVSIGKTITQVTELTGSFLRAATTIGDVLSPVLSAMWSLTETNVKAIKWLFDEIGAGVRKVVTFFSPDYYSKKSADELSKNPRILELVGSKGALEQVTATGNTKAIDALKNKAAQNDARYNELAVMPGILEQFGKDQEVAAQALRNYIAGGNSTEALIKRIPKSKNSVSSIPGSGTGKTKGRGDSDIPSITGDKKVAQNFIINIAKQVETLNINTTNINQSAEKIAEMIKLYFLNAMNDVQTSIE